MPRNDRRTLRVPSGGGAVWDCTYQQRLLVEGTTPGSFAWAEQVSCSRGGSVVTLTLEHGEFDRLSDAELLERIERATG